MVRPSNSPLVGAPRASGLRPLAWLTSGGPFARLAKVLGVVAVAAAAGAALAPWTVSRNALRSEIAEQLRASSGLYVHVGGAATFSLLPRPAVRLADVAFADPGGALVVQAAELRGQARLLPLLGGRLELAQAELDHPHLTLDLDGRPLTGDGAVARAADARPASAEARKADSARLAVVTFIGGKAQIKRAGQTVETINAIDATLDWRVVSAPAALDGEATWRGRRIAVAAWLARPSELLRGEASKASLEMRAPDLDFSAKGALTLGQRPHFEGVVAASSPAPSELFQLAGLDTPPLFSRAAAAIEGDCVATASTLTFAAVKITLGPNALSGALALRWDETRPLLSGTLAAKTLSLAPSLMDAPRLIGPDRHFSRDPFEPRPVELIDLDLRLSAGELRLAGLRGEDVAGSLMIKDGRLDVSIMDARFYKGAAKAHVVIAPRAGPGYEVKANLSAHDIDWGAMDWDQLGHARLTGRADVAATVEGEGASPDQLARNLAGHADIKIVDGEIVGVDIDRILKRMERRPLSTAADIRSGRTPFAAAQAALDVRDGLARVVESRVEGTGYAAQVTGAAQLPERQITLRASVTGAIAPPAADPPTFAFDLAGSWDALRLAPDVDSFIRRSGAARSLAPPQIAPDKASDPADAKGDPAPSPDDPALAPPPAVLNGSPFGRSAE